MPPRLQGDGVNEDAPDNYEDRQHAQPEVGLLTLPCSWTN